MEKFKQLDGLVVPLDRANVDTDAIIPKQFLKSIKRSGFGPNLFDEWRYLDDGEPGQDCSKRPLNPDFILNQERYRGARIMLTRNNFGCGSSREHAAWALRDFGIRCLMAPSFADIFYRNCANNGLLLIKLQETVVDRLFREIAQTLGYRLAVDLETQTVSSRRGAVIQFDIDPGLKHRLLNGLDDIGVTLESAGLIREYEKRRMREAPWLFQDMTKPPS